MTVALEVELKAEMRQFERNMLQASNTTETRLRQVERRFERANRQLAQNKGFSQAASGLQSITGGAPAAIAGLGKLGIAGVAAGTAIGALSVALNKAGAVAQWADDLQTAADVAGTSAVEMQRFRHAAAVADVDLAAADKSLRGLNASLGAFQSGVGAGRVEKVFARLGITKEDVKDAQSATDFLPLLADRISQVQSKAERVKLAKALQAEDLLPLLELGAERMRKLGDEAERLGLVLDGGTIKALADANEELRVANERMDLASKAIFANFVPGLVAIKNASADATVGLANLINKLRELPQDRLNQLQGFLLSGAPMLGPVGSQLAGTTLRGIGAATTKRTPTMSAEDWMLMEALRKADAAGGGGSPITPSTGTKTKNPADSIFTGPDANGFIPAENIGLIEAMDHAIVDVTEAFKGLVREIGQNPDLKEGPPVLAKLGDQFLSPEDFEAIEKNLYDALRGGLQAAFDDGVPGVARYLANAVQQALLDSIARSLTSTILQAASKPGANAIGSFVTAIFGGGKMADGGLVHGPGGPRSDRVPIMASNGEFVVNAAATRENRHLLEAINMGQVKRFADGGLVLSPTNEVAHEVHFPSPRGVIR